MTPTFDIRIGIVVFGKEERCHKCQLVEQTPPLTKSVPLSLALFVSLSDSFDVVVGDDLQVYDVLHVLREDVAGMGSSQDGVNESTLLGNLEDGVDVVGKVGLEVLAFAAVAGAETFSDDIAVLVENGDADFVEDELLVVVGNAIDDFSRSPEAEDTGKNFRAAFEQRRFGRIWQTIVVTPCFEMFGNDGFDVIGLNDGRFFSLASSGFSGRFIHRNVSGVPRRGERNLVGFCADGSVNDDRRFV